VLKSADAMMMSFAAIPNDPCVEGAQDCSDNAVCHRANIPGGYVCVCEDGYTGDGYDCVRMFGTNIYPVWMAARPIRSGVTVTQLLCSRYHSKCTEVPHTAKCGRHFHLSLRYKMYQRVPPTVCRVRFLSTFCIENYRAMPS
jgi:hypothetical protein